VFWIFLSFVVVSLFSFASVAVWAGTKHRERKDFYRSEMLKKLAESGSAAVIEYIREEERRDEVRRAVQQERIVEGNRLVGLILVVVGATVVVALYQIVPEEPVYLFGLVPFGIGVVFLMMPLLGGRLR
jgi:hypothetical protein